MVISKEAEDLKREFVPLPPVTKRRRALPITNIIFKMPAIPSTQP